jgi:hypothetical protein
MRVGYPLFLVLCAAAMAGAMPARAQTGPVVVIPGKAGVPVIIDGVIADGAVVYGDWGLARPGHGELVIEGPVGMRAATIRRPGTGRASAATKSTRGQSVRAPRAFAATGRPHPTSARLSRNIRRSIRRRSSWRRARGGAEPEFGAMPPMSKASSPEPLVTRERKKMSGRPVRLLAAATVAAAASLLSISTASAGCYSGCGGYSPPVAYYAPPVVSYASPCTPCGGSYGYGSYGYAPQRPMYVVNQGPSYAEPVVGEAEGGYEPGYRRPYPYLGEGGVRWHRRHWQRGYGHRGYGHRGFGYRHHGSRYGYRDYGYRSRAFAPGYRHAWRPRHPMVGPGGIYRPRHPMVGPGGIYRGPRHSMNMPRMNMYRMHMNRMPGVVHPRPMGGGAPKKLP